MFIAGPGTGTGPADTVGQTSREQPERRQVTSRAEKPLDGRDSCSVAQDQASSIGVMQCAMHARGHLVASSARVRARITLQRGRRTRSSRVSAKQFSTNEDGTLGPSMSRSCSSHRSRYGPKNTGWRRWGPMPSQHTHLNWLDSVEYSVQATK